MHSEKINLERSLFTWKGEYKLGTMNLENSESGWKRYNDQDIISHVSK